MGTTLRTKYIPHSYMDLLGTSLNPQTLFSYPGGLGALCSIFENSGSTSHAWCLLQVLEAESTNLRVSTLFCVYIYIHVCVCAHVYLYIHTPQTWKMKRWFDVRQEE